MTFGPGRIAVELKFREPVAWVKVEKTQQIIDGEGRLLPSDDVDVELAGPLIQITGLEPGSPADSRAGVVWKSKSAGQDVERVDERIVAAARLARFLKERVGSDHTNVSRSLRMIQIIVTEFAGRGLFMVNSEGTVLLLGTPPRLGRAPGVYRRGEVADSAQVEWSGDRPHSPGRRLLGLHGQGARASMPSNTSSPAHRAGHDAGRPAALERPATDGNVSGQDASLAVLLRLSKMLRGRGAARPMHRDLAPLLSESENSKRSLTAPWPTAWARPG